MKDLVITPTRRKFALARNASPRSVPAPSRITVKYVSFTFSINKIGYIFLAAIPVMHQPPIRPDVEGMGLVYGEIEHLLGLLDGGDIGNDACGAVGLFDLIANLEVACADPIGVQVLVTDGFWSFTPV